MAEVMSMLPDENSQGELNADEQESLAIGQEMAAEQETMLAGKYRNAEELEAAYIELQKKLGGDQDEYEEEQVYEDEDEVAESLFDRLWEQSQSDEFDEDTLQELAESDPAELAKMYLEYRNNSSNTSLSNEEAAALKGSVGGEEQYAQMVSWAKNEFPAEDIEAYDSMIESGNMSQIKLAIQGLYYRYTDSVGQDGNMLQGKPAQAESGFRSQAELIQAMNDPRYESDPAYRQDVLEKLDRSDVQF